MGAAELRSTKSWWLGGFCAPSHCAALVTGETPDPSRQECCIRSTWSQQLTEQDTVLHLMDAGAGNTGPGSVHMAFKQDRDVAQRLQ